MERRYDRGGKASSEELLDELEMAYSSRRSIEIRTPAAQLHRVFACMVEQIDSGFGEKHARQMIQRIESQGPRNALYPIRVNGIRSELELQWNRDADGGVSDVIGFPPFDDRPALANLQSSQSTGNERAASSCHSSSRISSTIAWRWA